MQPENDIDKRAHNFSLCAVIAFALLMLPFSEANDLGFLLNDGRYVGQFGFPHEDPFTMHEGLHFVMHQWLTAVTFWQIYSVWGTGGLFVLIAAVGAALLYLYYRLMLEVSDNKTFSLVMLLLFGFVLSIMFFVVRPQMFSSLLLMTGVLVLEKHYVTLNNKYLAALPVLSLLLANFHAAVWPMLAVVMLPYIVTSLALKWGENYFVWGNRANLKPLLLTLVAVIAAAFVNPYGYESVIYGFKSYGIQAIKEGVVELQPLTSRLEIGKIFLPLFLGVICLCARHKTKLHYLLFSLGFMYMSLDAVRNIIFFILFGMLPVAEYFRGRTLSSDNDAPTLPEFKSRHIVMLLLCLGIIALSIVGNFAVLTEDFRRNMGPLRQFFLLAATSLTAAAFYYECKRQILRLAAVPQSRAAIVKIGSVMYLFVVFAFVIVGIRTPYSSISYRGVVPGLDYIAAHDSRPNLPIWLECNMGSYAGFRGFKPYMDTRMEHFFKQNNGKDDYFKEMLKLENGTLHYRDFLAKYNFAYILVNNKDILYTYLSRDSDYELLYEYDIEPEESRNEKEKQEKTEHYRLFRPR